MPLAEAQEVPRWLLTDREVPTAEEAIEMFRRCRQRWAIEGACAIGSQCPGSEEVQVLAYEVVGILVALGWAAAGLLYALGVSLKWAEVAC